MLPLSTYISKLRLHKNRTAIPIFIQQSRLFEKTLANQYASANQYALASTLQAIPLIPVISFVKTKTGVKSELKFKYIWRWKRPRQNYIFITKLGLGSPSKLGSFYF